MNGGVESHLEEKRGRKFQVLKGCEVDVFLVYDHHRWTMQDQQGVMNEVDVDKRRTSGREWRELAW